MLSTAVPARHQDRKRENSFLHIVDIFAKTFMNIVSNSVCLTNTCQIREDTMRPKTVSPAPGIFLMLLRYSKKNFVCNGHFTKLQVS